MTDYSITCTGPLFDGTADREMNQGTTAVRQKLASEGKKLVIAAFVARIKDNHGRFLNTVTTIDQSRTFQTGKYTLPEVIPDPVTDTLVTTDLATYGPWLEGEGSRNSITRFRGYHGFRMAAQALNLVAEGIAEDEIKPYVVKCN